MKVFCFEHCIVHGNMRLAQQNLVMFAHKLKLILLPKLIATLNNYACSILPLANVSLSAFPECFLLLDHIN